MRSARDLLNELNAVDESTRIEAKRSSELGKSVMQTVVAFANEPGLDGGYLLLGADWYVNEKGDTVYRAAGVPDPDKVQRELATQCAAVLNVAIRPEMQTDTIDGKTLIVVYVGEADVTHKPVYLKATGLPGGAYRRIGSTDQRCVDEDLWVLRGESQPVRGPDSSILADARLSDLDPGAIAVYRRDRARINPQAEELAYDDEDMLESLGALRRVDGALHPTLAGIVLFGKPLALRRLLPAIRIDYIRVPGNEWVEDPENRFQSIDIRKPLLLALPQAEASVVDELPKGFRLPEGKLQSIQEPILPRKVIREALANAAMHRSYTIHSPTQIVRFSNRLEIRNVGYSLKEPSQLGMPGSRLRNPMIAAVLHDLNLAEAKGTGIRAMRRLSADAGLPLPEFHSDRQANEFRLTLFLHNLLTEDDHIWLKNFAGQNVTSDEAKVLIYARATGAVDNTACREFCGLDTLAASQVLRRLRDRRLLEKQGGGNRTYYTLRQAIQRGQGEQVELALDIPPSLGTNAWGDTGYPPMSNEISPQAAHSVPADLLARIKAAGVRPRKESIRAFILELCRLQAFTAAELCQVLGRTDAHELRRAYLRPLRDQGLIELKFPESEKHPNQAYLTVALGDEIKTDR